MGGNLLSALGALFVTILILVLAYWTSRWVGLHAAPGPSGWPGSNLRILARVGVGRSACLLVVRVRERCLLLGVTEGGITLLKEWEGEEADAWLAESSADNGFPEVLRDALRRRTRSPRRNDHG